MPLDFTITNADGLEGQVSVNDVVQKLQATGQPIAGISADGMTVKLEGPKGTVDLPITDAIKGLGWDVVKAAPTNANYDAVNPDWRTAITVLPGDEHKKAYLEGQFAKGGMKGATVVGSGRDWFAFDPESNQYIALTNNPEWDMSDVREGVVGAPRLVGSVLGGGLGAVAGGGANPVTGAIGAGLGGASADAITRGIVASRDPMVREIMAGDMGAVAKDVGVNAAFDAGATGLTMGAGKVFGPQVKAMMNSGPVSSAVRGMGKIAEEGGKLVNRAASVLDRPIGREGVAALTPGAAELGTAGYLAQLPGQASRAMARGASWLGNKFGYSQFGKEAAPEAAEAAQHFGRQIVRTRPGAKDAVDDMAALFRGESNAAVQAPKGRPTTEDVYGNLGEFFGVSSAERKALRRTMQDSYRQARQYGIDPAKAKSLAEEAVEEILPGRAKNAREVGRAFGRGLQTLEDLGQSMERGATKISSGLLKGARAGGYATEKAGQAAKNLGKLGQPVENRLLAKYGAEELYRPEISPSDAWQEKRKRDRLGVILADQ